MKKATSSPKRPTKRQQAEKNRRKFLVFISLLGALTLTSVLLLAVSPAPLTSDAASCLFAVDQSDTLEEIFQTKAASQPGQWKYLFIHHSRTPAGNAQTLGRASQGLGDHFVIGNGDGCRDGEIQISQRWNQQLPAKAPAGATFTDPAGIISICLVGDFDQTRPTPLQLLRTSQLVNALQSRYRIPAQSVVLLSPANSTASTGLYFDATAFRTRLLP